MKPIPTPSEIHAKWTGSSMPMDIFTFTHSILAPMIEEARNAQQPEPWGEGHRLLVPGNDVIQKGDEFFDGTWKPFLSVCHGEVLHVELHICRRPLRNPWRRIKDAPPEHKDQRCVVTGGRLDYIGAVMLRIADPTRTHYFPASDLPPVPPEPEPRDLEREKFEVWFFKDGTHPQRQDELAWEAWQAARKEAV